MRKSFIITTALILLGVSLWLVHIVRTNNSSRSVLTSDATITPQIDSTPSIQPGWHYAVYKMWGQSPITGEGATLNVGVSLPPSLEYTTEDTSAETFRVVGSTSEYWTFNISLVDKSKESIKRQYIDWLENDTLTGRCMETLAKQIRYSTNAQYFDVNITCKRLYEDGHTYTTYQGAYLMQTSGFLVRINKYKNIEDPANVVSSNPEIEPYLPSIFASLTIKN